MTVWGVICVALISTLWVMRRHTGVSLLITGLVSNLLVVLINDGMPYFVGAGSDTHDAGDFYHAAGASTRMWLLSDVLPLPGGYLLSLGDLLLLVGLVSFVVAHATGVDSTGGPS